MNDYNIFDKLILCRLYFIIFKKYSNIIKFYSNQISLEILQSSKTELIIKSILH